MEKASRPGTQHRPKTVQRTLQRGFYSEVIGANAGKSLKVRNNVLVGFIPWNALFRTSEKVPSDILMLLLELKLISTCQVVCVCLKNIIII